MGNPKRSVLRTTGSILNGTATFVSDTIHWGLFGIGAVAAVAKIGWDEAKRGYTQTDELLSSADQDQDPEQQELDLGEHHRS